VTRELESLPEGTRFTDVLEAAQAAWLAKNYVLSRDLIQRYIDADGEFCCMRCAATEEQPWKINNHLGTFYVCPPCSTLISQQGEILGNGGEMYIEGPPQKVSQIMETYKIGDMMVVKTTSSRALVTLSKK